jgi:hypothetical protein
MLWWSCLASPIVQVHGESCDSVTTSNARHHFRWLHPWSVNQSTCMLPADSVVIAANWGESSGLGVAGMLLQADNEKLYENYLNFKTGC